jgi:hypothetical protein
MDKAALPVLASVRDLAELVLFTNCRPKSGVEFDKKASGAGPATAVPESVITWGLPGALSAIEIAPNVVPDDVGLKMTLMVQLA